jgi:hypothetical protein
MTRYVTGITNLDGFWMHSTKEKLPAKGSNSQPVRLLLRPMPKKILIITDDSGESLEIYFKNLERK